MIYLSGKVRADLPAMLQPGMGNLPPAGQPWAADNGRYASPETYTDAAYLEWLERRAGERDRCLFATAPDVWGDARATLDLSLPMLAPIRAAGYRVALVAQDGLEELQVPWDRIDALFVGGSDPWRRSEGLVRLVAEAKRRGLWVHMGRVNSLRRMRWAASLGCDSADGTVLKHDLSRDVGSWGARVRDEPSLWRRGA